MLQNISPNSLQKQSGVFNRGSFQRIILLFQAAMLRIILALVVCGVEVAYGQGTPSVTSVSPNFGPVGTSVTISGTGFGADQGSSTLTICNTQVTPSSWSDTSIVASIPTPYDDTGVCYAVVSVDGTGASDATSASRFDVSPPSISGPSGYGMPGDMIAIQGSNFGADQGTVTFNGVAATILNWMGDSIIVYVPDGATTGNMVVTTSHGVASNAVQFIIIHPTNFFLTSATSATPGLLQLRTWGFPWPAVVSYSSSDLVNQPAGDYLIQAFDTATGSPNSSGTWQAILPAGVTIFMEQTAGSTGTLFPKVKLLLNGPSGTPICEAISSSALTTTLTGYDLRCTPSADLTITAADRYYLWVGVNSTVIPSDSTQFQLTIGAGLGRGWGLARVFVPLRAHIPNITGTDSQSYTAGSSFTITGTDFGTTAGTVTLNGEAAVVSSWSDTSITALVPNDACGSFSNISVINANNVQSNPWPISVIAAINGLTPAAAPVGSSIVISGSGFGPAAGTVFFADGTTMGTVSSWTDTSITATVPSGTVTGDINVQPADFGAFWSNPVTFTVIPLVSLTLTPESPSIALDSTSQLRLRATGTYSDGSTQDLTANVIWTTSNPSVATPLSVPGFPGLVGLIAQGTTTISASTNGVSGSTLVTVTPPAPPLVPNIMSVSPPSGVPGTQVTIAGTNFGTTQGTGSVWIGSMPGSVVSWSDTQVVASTATNAVSGNIRTFQSGSWSNSVFFEIAGPTILSVAPLSGLPGTSVTITGSGFRATQGNGQLLLGTSAGVVSTWSDTQIVATVAAGSTTGEAQVLQNGVLSNEVDFAVNTPNISHVTPISGAAGTAVTVNGSGFGDSQGSGVVWIGNVPGVVSTWSNIKIVANVDANALSGVVRVQQNGFWSNTITFTVPGSTNVKINPAVVSMLIGETRSLQALDVNSQPVAGLTWTSSDTSVATLSTDDPPILTAVAAGHVSISAGSASTDLTVYPGAALPLGTVRWSVSGDSSVFRGFLPAVPSDSGVDIFFSQQSGNVLALKADGSVLWSANPLSDHPTYSIKLIPDFQGGLIASLTPPQPAGPTPIQLIKRLDAATGQNVMSYSVPTLNGSPVLVHPDGTIFTQQIAPDFSASSIIGIDPVTGTQKFSIPLDQTVDGSTDCHGQTAGHSVPIFPLGQIIAGDGYAYYAYAYNLNPPELNVTVVCTNSDTVTTVHKETHYKVLRVGTDGTFSKIAVRDWQLDQVITCHLRNCTTASTGSIPGQCNIAFFPGVPFPCLDGQLITNADQGIMLLWQGGQASQQAASISSSGSLSIAPVGFSEPIIPMLQREDGTFYGMSEFSLALVNFDQSGTVKWSSPFYEPMTAIAGGGVAARARAFGRSGMATFDQDGNVVGQDEMFSSVVSWSGNQYGNGDGFSSLVSWALPPLDMALSYWPSVDGNASRTHQPPTLLMTHAYPTPQDSTGISPDEIKAQTRRAVPLNPSSDTPVTHTFLMGEALSTSNFVKAAELTSQALAYIGHALLEDVQLIDGTHFIAPIGLWMGTHAPGPNGQLVNVRLRIAPDPNPPPQLSFLSFQEYSDDFVKGVDIPQGPMQPRTNVIFIGSCGSFSISFQYWFNTNSATKKRALIVPTDLRDPGTGQFLEVPGGVARYAWTLIAQDLAKGKTVGQAVQAANQTIHVPGLFDIIVPADFQWIVVGDANLKLRPTSQ
jgi:hypothetical protein